MLFAQPVLVCRKQGPTYSEADQLVGLSALELNRVGAVLRLGYLLEYAVREVVV